MSKIITVMLLVGLTGCASHKDVYNLEMRVDQLNYIVTEQQKLIDDNARCCKRNQDGMDRLYQKMVGK